jgi:N-acetylglucosaminyl-diphospho-decaprenol L-rhamnosyltransferase
VVVVTYCNLATADRCLASMRSRQGEFTVTVVDNASPDGTGDHVGRYHPRVRLIRNRLNVGFAAAVNQGPAVARVATC